jgi:hypothetical protein
LRFALASTPRVNNNHAMVIPGPVRNGVVVLEGEWAFPEGAVVTVTYSAPAPTPPAAAKRRTEIPLVRTGQPGSVQLSGERIAQIMDEEDALPRR